MNVIDRKFKICALNPINGKEYTEENALLLCAKDAAVPAALEAYRDKCIELEANVEHVMSIEKLIQRVNLFQSTIECRVPDTIGDELIECLKD